MKKGSKAIHCYMCKQIIGWRIPTGKTHHGIPEITYKLSENAITHDRGFERRYYCKICFDIKNA